MTIDEIRDAREKAESEILHVLTNLKRATGLCPIEVTVTAMTIYRMEMRHPQQEPSVVRVRLESI